MSVAVPRPVWNTYTYILPESMQGGPGGLQGGGALGGSRVAGVIWGEDPETSGGYRLKSVLERLDSRPLLPPSVLSLLRWASDYYISPRG